MCNIKSKYNIGDTVKVFDGNDWSKHGDIDDNSCYFKEAIIINIRSGDLYNLIDVKFNNGIISNGHFENSIKTN
jgi:hypothetical protein